MASNPGRIPAGGKDKISVVVHTNNRGGTYLNKRFAVHTNDPRMGQVNLKVVGQVKAYVNYSPKFIRFFGQVGQSLSQTIKLIPDKAHPFKIKKVIMREGKHLRYELKPLSLEKGPAGYLLTVYNTMETVGTYRDDITIETNSKVKPKLKIPVSGKIRNPNPRAKKSNP